MHSGYWSRYASFADRDINGEIRYLMFKQLDSPLAIGLVVCVLAVLIGLVMTSLGLAFHHYRRHHELQHALREPHVHESNRQRAGIGIIP